MPGVPFNQNDGQVYYQMRENYKQEIDQLKHEIRCLKRDLRSARWSKASVLGELREAQAYNDQLNGELRKVAKAALEDIGLLKDNLKLVSSCLQSQAKVEADHQKMQKIATVLQNLENGKRSSWSMTKSKMLGFGCAVVLVIGIWRLFK